MEAVQIIGVGAISICGWNLGVYLFRFAVKKLTASANQIPGYHSSLVLKFLARMADTHDLKYETAIKLAWCTTAVIILRTEGEPSLDDYVAEMKRMHAMHPGKTLDSK